MHPSLKSFPDGDTVGAELSGELGGGKLGAETARVVVAVLLLLLLGRIPDSSIIPLRSATRTCLLLFQEGGGALVANPMDTATRTLVGSARRRGMFDLGIRGVVLVVVAGRLVALRWFSRALLATVVAAIAADLYRAEISLAAMAFAMNPLTHRLANEIAVAGAAGDGDSVGEVVLALLVSNLLPLLALLLLLLLLGLLGRIARALLAPLMTALIAGLFGAVGSLALVARAMNTHANVLLDTLGGGLLRLDGPVRDVDAQAVLLEESLGAFGGRLDRRRTARRLGAMSSHFGRLNGAGARLRLLSLSLGALPSLGAGGDIGDGLFH